MVQIYVAGEAGVSKSRVVYEVLCSHHTQGWLVLESASGFSPPNVPASSPGPLSPWTARSVRQ